MNAGRSCRVLVCVIGVKRTCVQIADRRNGQTSILEEILPIEVYTGTAYRVPSPSLVSASLIIGMT